MLLLGNLQLLVEDFAAWLQGRSSGDVCHRQNPLLTPQEPHQAAHLWAILPFPLLPALWERISSHQTQCGSPPAQCVQMPAFQPRRCLGEGAGRPALGAPAKEPHKGVVGAEHRITELKTLEGTSGGHVIQPTANAGSLLQMTQKSIQVALGISREGDSITSLCSPCQGSGILTLRKFFCIFV